MVLVSLSPSSRRKKRERDEDEDEEERKLWASLREAKEYLTTTLQKNDDLKEK